jgi:hypothetical protein
MYRGCSGTKSGGEGGGLARVIREGQILMVRWAS